MRLHQLTVTAFGPFAGTERVDFDQLASAGLFLLRGATGAGKSSVLDAVCFALYGEVPGARKGNPLRSDHADPLLLTEVRLDVTLGGRRLEITRSPEQKRPKRRGTGLTTEKPQTLLREWCAELADGSAGWRAVSKSHQEAGEEIRRLIGMSRDQFCQVVLLPQGDFARFLRADANDRAALLRQLFDTGRFDQVERWLGEQRRGHEAKVQAGLRGLRDLAGRAHEVAGPAAEPAGGWVPGEDGPPAELADGLLAWAAILRGGAAEQLAVAHSALAAAESAQEAAQRHHERAGELADRQRRHRAAVLEAARLADSSADLARDQQRLTAAQAAVGVESLLRLRDGAATAHRSAERTERERRAEAGADPAVDADGLAATERQLREQLGRLAAARSDEQRHAELGREQEQLTHERGRAEEAAEDAQEWLVGFDARLKTLQDDQTEARAAEARVEQLDTRRTELAGRLDAAARRDALRGRITQAEGELLTLRERALDARGHSQDLRERRLTGMAAELAGQLADGEPCRVCGSAVHPAPARPSGAQVSAEDEERARAVQLRAEQEAGDAESALTALRVDEASAAGAAGTQSVAELREALGSVEQHRREALRAADGLGLTTQRIAELTAEQHKQQSELRQAGEHSAALAAKVQTLAAERAELGLRVAAARGDAPSVAARSVALTSLADALAAAAGAARTGAETAARLGGAEHELRQAARAAGFADPEAARAALLSSTELSALKTRLESRRAARDAAEARLAEPELVAAAALPAVDLPMVQAELQAATTRLRTASAEENTARERLAALARIGRELTILAAELAPALERFGRINRLAGLAAGTSGENVLRMRLESYVLAARLEQVAAAASDRLVRMSGGRYTLVHSDDRVSGNRRSGLALRVVDAWTGIDRDTATLSGGESFFASLALALGLADVVTDEAGGMPLDTLFIDEGFGSLDEQTLEEVMDVLDGLRERDRAVGIVSHVPDLRSRIPAQLLVKKGRHGSTLRLADRESA
ncbi:SMC family ATPase [Kitasatospora sp. MAP5-34]|uniref:SMC family ATPase n=1 Tax=Kitasatospora sp. MAP5-34 TaxID=3035102 RepID=UPI002476D482|nr:SMC family ATPase [Kitasatospora sp. MAP5-34]MDH6575257.1 exonuclease SbcC [Kitasatospora sp. MAP5-34]